MTNTATAEKATRTPSPELPAVAIGAVPKGFEFPNTGAGGKGRAKVPNPYLDACRTAAAKRDQVYAIDKITTEPLANKVKSLLSKAASELRAAGIVCSFRSMWDDEAGKVYFQAIDYIPRTRSAESQKRTDG